MKRVLLKRIFFSYFILAALLLIILGNYLSSTIKNNYISKLRENLTVQGSLIAEDIPLLFKDNLDDFCKRYKDKTGARITIIDSSGRVLGDSDEPSSLMDNHANRQEIIEAETDGIGSVIRFSKTVHKNSFYLALAITKDSQKRFLRMSVPLHDIEVAVRKIKIQILTASFASLLIVFLIGFIQTGRIVKTIEEITAFSKEVASGNFTMRLFPKGKDELGELTKNVSDMSQELKRRLQQSAEEKYMIEAILMNMSDGLMLTDPKGRILLSNAAIKNFFSIESGIEGKTVMETLRKAELMEAIDKVVETGETISREVEVAYPKELYLMVTAAPFSVKGERSGVVLAFHDITRLKQLEDMRKDFVANVSHEIKTPITAIKGFAETLLEGALDDRENAYKFLETIKNHSERLNSLVNDLLTLSRIEIGDMKIEKEDVNLDNVIDTVFETLKEKAQGKGLYLRKEISPITQAIKADRNRLIQILINLVDNGIKFTEKGGVTIRVQSSKSKIQIPPYPPFTKGGSGGINNLSVGDFVEISVEDTGIGIPKKHLSRLGERFYRVDKARSRELGGTGLGLAIVKHLVIAHSWEMEIESTPGKGTAVKIIIPSLT
jgi:two-component system, OmpR family, phosphate regulon sensor histidine kinase PhoR